MVIYNCPRCGYSTKLKGNFRHHLNRKRVCKSKESNICIDEVKKQYGMEDNMILSKDKHRCKFCDEKFTRSDNLKRHMKYRCKKKNVVLYEQSKIEQLENEIKDMKVFIENNLSKCSKTINTTNNIKVNTINNKIIINNFGSENMDYINDNFIRQIVTEGSWSCLPKFIKQLHFNEDHPENHNVAITNLKNKYGKINMDGEWVTVLKKKIVNDMLVKRMGYLEERFYNIIATIPKNKQKSFTNWCNKLDYCDDIDPENKILKGKITEYIETIKMLIYDCTEQMKIQSSVNQI